LTALVAEMVKVVVPAVVGVPEMMPVAGSRVSPAGRDPVAAKLGAGFPVPTSVNV
jgi:hypothetical protein